MDTEKSKELWDRLENEPERAYRAFEPYLTLPSGERTMLEAYRHHVGNPAAAKSSDTWNKWSSQFAWRERTVEGGKCRIRIYREDGRAPVVVCSQLPDNDNTSVTNMVEYLVAEVIEQHGLSTPLHGMDENSKNRSGHTLRVDCVSAKITLLRSDRRMRYAPWRRSCFPSSAQVWALAVLDTSKGREEVSQNGPGGARSQQQAANTPPPPRDDEQELQRR